MSEPTMKVRVRDSAAEAHSWSDERFRPVIRTITISAVCPVCGGPRGEAREHTWTTNNVPYIVDVWGNPCGHVDYYENVVKEAAARRVKLDEAP